MIEQLKRVAADVRGDVALAGRLADDASLIDDAELDSLQMLTFMLKVEETLGVEIDFERLEFELLHSLEALGAYLESMPRSRADA